MSIKTTLISAILSASMALGGVVQSANAQDVSNADQFHLYYPSPSGSFLAGRSAFLDHRADKAASYFVDALSADWDNIVLLDRAFMSLLASGRVEEAEDIARRLIELEPNNEIARLVLGVVALKERRYRSVQNALSDMSKDTLFGITSNVVLGWSQIGDGNPKKGIDTVEDITQQGFQGFLVFQRALMADVGGDKKNAELLYAQAHKVDPFVFSIVDAYARFLANNGRFDEALAVIERFNSRGLSHENIANLTETIKAGKRPGKMAENVQQGAAELLRGLSSALSREAASNVSLVLMRLATYMHPKSDFVAFSLADILEQSERYVEANGIYAKIPRKSNLHGTALVRTAENLRELGEVDGAIKTLTNIVNHDKSNITAILALGDTLRSDERYEEAKQIYSQALEITKGELPTDWHLFYVRGIAFERLGEWDKAESDFKKALTIYPDQPQVLNYLGYSWVDQGINLSEALAMIEEAVSLRPNDGYIVDSLGWAYFRLGRFEDAVETLERATRLTPSDPTINDHLGDAYWRVGRKREAGFQWAKSLDMDPDEDLIEILNEKLKSGLQDDTTVADAG
ncbi:tetratricopeptide repeat protein [Maritalea sp.]|uniref:tetratricopeptide repeat protein n=1 Tax=Maritalea sp. TaxID=2003361 RepID=UPI003EF78212